MPSTTPRYRSSSPQRSALLCCALLCSGHRPESMRLLHWEQNRKLNILSPLVLHCETQIFQIGVILHKITKNRDLLLNQSFRRIFVRTCYLLRRLEGCFPSNCRPTTISNERYVQFDDFHDKPSNIKRIYFFLRRI